MRVEFKRRDEKQQQVGIASAKTLREETPSIICREKYKAWFALDCRL